MAIKLEVIVTSVREAIEAERGGADRLELVADLQHGGLTPPEELVKQVVENVSIPVRVMLRETASMSMTSAAELNRLRSKAKALSALQINGLVLGFIKDGIPHLDPVREILAEVPAIPATFHRAFDLVEDRLYAIEVLRTIPQIDRLLTDGGEGSWEERKLRIGNWQRVCEPTMQVIFAIGSDVSGLSQLENGGYALEVHVGRAARVPQSTSGTVIREQVAALRRALDLNGSQR